MLKPGATLTLLYTGKLDGWRTEEFHRNCDDKGPTLVLYKSTAGGSFGGYTSLSWQKDKYYQIDRESFIFSLDDRELVFKPYQPQHAVFQYNNWGPSFGAEDLGIEGQVLNAKDAGKCHIRKDRAYDCLTCDEQGKHVLTKDGAGKDNYSKTFTCEALEVYSVSYS